MSAQPYKPRYSRLPSDTIVTMTLGNLREFARETMEVYFVNEKFP